MQEVLTQPFAKICTTLDTFSLAHVRVFTPITLLLPERPRGVVKLVHCKEFEKLLWRNSRRFMGIVLILSVKLLLRDRDKTHFFLSEEPASSVGLSKTFPDLARLRPEIAQTLRRSASNLFLTLFYCREPWCASCFKSFGRRVTEFTWIIIRRFAPVVNSSCSSLVRSSFYRLSRIVCHRCHRCVAPSPVMVEISRWNSASLLATEM